MTLQGPKYVFVTGGVLSGVGKGITAASIGNILKARDLDVNIQKCDPYLNFDAGTLNPGEHGECFVTVDGAETDLDLGHYERYMDVELTQTSSLMSGRVLGKVIEDERAGKYLGKTVQIIPHVTQAIIDEIQDAAEGFDVHIVEIGGTVGDYEGLSFIEAIRELTHGEGAQKTLDCSSAPSARRAAVQAARSWGTACFVGERGEVTFDVSADLLRRQITLVGSWTFSKNGQADCAEFVADRKIDVGKLFTDRWTLGQAEEAYKLFDTQSTGKGVITPN